MSPNYLHTYQSMHSSIFVSIDEWSDVNKGLPTSESPCIIQPFPLVFLRKCEKYTIVPRMIHLEGNSDVLRWITELNGSLRDHANINKMKFLYDSVIHVQNSAASLIICYTSFRNINFKYSFPVLLVI
jgi:hypothetical protein